MRIRKRDKAASKRTQQLRRNCNSTGYVNTCVLRSIFPISQQLSRTNAVAHSHRPEQGENIAGRTGTKGTKERTKTAEYK